MNFDISILNWIFLFITYFIFDLLYVKYVLSVSKLNAIQAANLSALLYLLTAYGTIEFVTNILNIIPIIVASWFGTYLAIWYEGKKVKKKDKESK